MCKYNKLMREKGKAEMILLEKIYIKTVCCLLFVCGGGKVPEIIPLAFLAFARSYFLIHAGAGLGALVVTTASRFSALNVHEKVHTSHRISPNDGSVSRSPHMGQNCGPCAASPKLIGTMSTDAFA